MSDLSLVPLRVACVPRDDVLQGGLADNHFAAQLDKVVRDAEHYPVYGDAEAFFCPDLPDIGIEDASHQGIRPCHRSKGCD